MYQKTVTLDNSDRLLVEWESGISNMTIKKDGEIIGSFKDIDEAKQGRRFLLPDHRQITVVYTEYGLEVWQDGKEMVSGGKSGSVNGFARAVRWLNGVGIAQFVVAPLLYLVSREEAPEKALSVAIAMCLIGAFLLGLSFWAKTTGSKTPFWVGLAFCVLNIIVTLGAGSGAGLIITGAMAYYLYKGTQAEVPEMPRKILSDPNAPLDADL